MHMNFSDLPLLLENEPQYRLKQIYEFVFKTLIDNWDQASTIPKPLRNRLVDEFILAPRCKIFLSKLDKTAKALIFTQDNLNFECVLMRNQKGRNTLCVSSQIGCCLGCTFCATGKMGYQRNLSDWEICQQVLLFARVLQKENKSISNIVFMGMGEPFLNYDNVLNAIQILNNPDGFNLGLRRFSISTVGIVEGIDKLAEEGLEINLAISLHAAFDERRRQLMKIADKYPIGAIIDSAKAYAAKTARKVMFEYLMLDGINDSDTDARKLAEIMAYKLFMVNLIKYNQTGLYQSSPQSRFNSFKSILEKAGVNVTQRYSFGQDINAACGQLAAKNLI